MKTPTEEPLLSIAPEDFKVIKKYAQAYVKESYHGVMAEDVMKQGLDTYFIVDIRREPDYCSGHIEGSVNIPFSTIADDDSLGKLPQDGSPILIYCYTGHTASQTTSLYNILGFNAYVLQFSAIAWRNVTQEAVWNASVQETIQGAGYPFVRC
jgi:rhodanese-related sulfurtransferase